MPGVESRSSSDRGRRLRRWRVKISGMQHDGRASASCRREYRSAVHRRRCQFETSSSACRTAAWSAMQFRQKRGLRQFGQTTSQRRPGISSKTTVGRDKTPFRKWTGAVPAMPAGPANGEAPRLNRDARPKRQILSYAASDSRAIADDFEVSAVRPADAATIAKATRQTTRGKRPRNAPAPRSRGR
jgi:hypothetical protein